MPLPVLNFWDDFIHLKNRSKSSNSHWNSADNEECYKKVAKNLEFNTYGFGEFYYRNNSHGFRSDEFDNDEEVKILYSGCSITEGIGLPVEHTWPSFFNIFLSQEIGKSVKLFNTGLGGASIDAIIRTVYLTIKKGLLKPDVVLMLLPSISRSEIFYQDRNGNTQIYNFIATYDKYSDPQLRALHDAQIKNYLPVQRVHDTFKSLLMLKEFLDSRKIPFYFQTWDSTLIHFDKGQADEFSNILKNHSPVELRKHVSPTRMMLDLVKQTPKYGLPFKQNIGRDGMHPGPNTHWNYARELFEWCKTQDTFSQLITKWKKNGN